MAHEIYIGTSGWAYKSWANVFYPPELSASQWLRYYTSTFPTVEINATFYRLPTPASIETWQRSAPAGFLYAVKGSRTVTHYFQLRPGAKSFDVLLQRVGGLGSTLGPMLWQLPGRLVKDLGRLESFLGRLPRSFRHAMEFRDPSWLDPEVYACLRRHEVALVAVSAGWFPVDLTLTTDFTYVRFHGLTGGAAHDYTQRELTPWIDHLSACAARGQRAFVYFNNDQNSRAPLNALALMRHLRDHAARPSGRTADEKGPGGSRVARPSRGHPNPPRASTR